jgi:twitching motility protein PilJ
MVYQQEKLTEENQVNDGTQNKINKVTIANKETVNIPKKGIGIGIKATILAFVFGVVPVSLVSWVSYYFADIAITRKFALEKIGEVQQLSDQLSSFLQERLNNTKSLVSIVNLIAPNINNINTEQKISLENSLTQFYRDYLVFENIAIYNLQGKVIVQSSGSAPELNKQKEQFFQDVLKTGVPVISEPIGEGETNTDRFAIYVATPIKDNQNKTMAIIAGRIPVNYLGNSVLRTASLQPGTSYKLVDSKGKIFQNFQDEQENPIGTNINQILPLYDEINSVRQSEAWQSDVSNKKYLNAYTPISSVVNLDWSLVTSTSPEVAFAAQKQLANTITIGTIIMAVLAVIVGAVIANLSIRPVLSATRVVEKLGQGKLDERLPVKGSDELAVLSSNINRMAAEIQSLLATVRGNAEQLSLQNNILSDLAKNEAVIQGNLKTAATIFTETVANALQVDRVSIFLYNFDTNSLVSVAIFDRLKNEHWPEISLSFNDYPDYIKALNEDETIIAFDVNANPITAELVNNDLANIGIKSKLDIPISIAGKTVGAIACEQISQPRSWKPQEQTFVASVANLTALTLESETLQTEVGEILDFVSDVEAGNLTVKAKVSDRTTGLVADTLNRLIEELSQVLQQVLNTAKQVSEGTDNLQVISKTVAEGTIKQAQAVTQVKNLSQQVENSVQNATEKVQTTKESLSSLELTVKEGENTITSLTQSISILQQGADKIIQQMKTLGEFVGLADQFVQDQGDIAQQTQVLALNASLVAARAGEQKDPRRFEMVAQEFEQIANQVSILAQKTNEGLTALEERTGQIHTVVATVDTEVQNLGNLVGGFTKGVEESNRLFEGVKNVTEKALIAEENVAQSNQEILTATLETVKAIKNIEKTTMETANITKNSLKQSEIMEKLSHELLERIKFFKLLE